MLQTLFLISMLADATGLVPILSLEPVPDEVDAFLSLPQDLAVGQDGQFYVVDSVAKCVFVWDKEGGFLGVFGKEGAGPGEFQFSGIGGPQAYLSALGEKVYVYDGARLAVSTFDSDRKFLGSVKFQIQGGRTEYFRMTPEGSYLVYQRSFRTDIPKRVVAIYNEKGEINVKIAEKADNSFTREGPPGQRPTGIVIHAYTPAPVVHYNMGNREIIIGDSASPSFEIYSEQGKLKKTVRFKMARQDVADADKQEFNEQPFIKNSNFMKADFPEQKTYYTHILPVAGKGYLVFSLSPFYRNAEGIWIDNEGKTQSRIRFTCGENGGFYGVNGRVFASQTNEDGDFLIHELAVK